MPEDRGLVVIVEDERAISDLQRLYLTQAGFGVHVARDGTTGLDDIRRLAPVAAVIDVGLPGIDGTEVVRRLRAEQNRVPIVIVTAHDSEMERVLGLELGADDYVTKPFSPRELVARVRSLIRRSEITQHAGSSQVLERGTVHLDVGLRRARVAGIEVELTTTEFDLLAYLFAHPHQIFSREQLLSAVWSVADYRGTRTVDVHVAQLRAKLGDPDPIRTVRGVGYGVTESSR